MRITTDMSLNSSSRPGRSRRARETTARAPSPLSALQARETARPVTQALHHGPGLIEIPEQLIHFGHRGAAAGRDAPAATAIEDTRPFALAGRHAEQDRLEALEPFVVGLRVLERRLRDARDHLDDLLERSHLLELLELLQEVLERELRLAEPFGL